MPLASWTFPLAHRAAACRVQKLPLHNSQWQIKAGRMGGFPHCPGAACARYQEIAPVHDDLAQVAYKFWRARKVPDRNLPRLGRIGEWWVIVSAPPPLRAGKCQSVVFVACHCSDGKRPGKL